MKQRDAFTIPAWLDKMVENKWLGDKTGQGFFKKTKGAGGEKEILTLNLANTGIWAAGQNQNLQRWKQPNQLMI